jgi:hypothetical protein
MNIAAAQGHSGGHGKPFQTGVEHAETVANPQGATARHREGEGKQGLHKGPNNTSKGKASGKHKSHKNKAAPH